MGCSWIWKLELGIELVLGRGCFVFFYFLIVMSLGWRWFGYGQDSGKVIIVLLGRQSRMVYGYVTSNYNLDIKM
jgi:hypothetical protein